MKWKAYIVEDEPLTRDELTYLLRRTGDVEVVGESDRLVPAFADIQTLQPDVVFLDIQLSEGNGLELARKLLHVEKPPAVAFVTAYDEHALEAFGVDALDYVLKPFDEPRIRRTINKLNKWKYKSCFFQKEKLALPIDDRIVLIDLKDLLFVWAEEGQVGCRTVRGEYRTGGTLAELERRLSREPFMRVHRSYIVNLDEVAEIEPWFNGTYHLRMTDGSRIPVSRTFAKNVRQALGF